MLEFLKNMANKTFTENGAVTLRSTGSDCLNLFATVGALRFQNEAEIEKRFLRAFAENGDLAISCRNLAGFASAQSSVHCRVWSLGRHPCPAEYPGSHGGRGSAP